MSDLVPVEITYEELYNLYGKGINEIPYEIPDDVYIETPTGLSRINHVITKHNHKVIKITLEDDRFFECSDKHLFQGTNQTPIHPTLNSLIKTKEGYRKVVDIQKIGNENVFDISIDSPHWYYSKNNIVHHNTYVALSVVKSFLDQNQQAVVLYFDSEAAISNKMMKERGIDTDRVALVEPENVQDFRDYAVEKLDQYLQIPESDRPKMMFVLDSLGMLPSRKELEDAVAKKDTRDLTKQQSIRSIFRTITLKLAKARIPFVVTNHVYQAIMAYVPTNIISGGGGTIFASDQILVITKSKDKDAATNAVTGNILTFKLIKSRLSKQDTAVKVKLTYDKGFDRYYGLLDLAEKYNIVKKVAKKYEFPDGNKAFEKAIYKNPTKFFTEQIMDQLEKAANKEFSYGNKTANEQSNDEEEIDDENEANSNE